MKSQKINIQIKIKKLNFFASSSKEKSCYYAPSINEKPKKTKCSEIEQIIGTELQDGVLYDSTNVIGWKSDLEKIVDKVIPTEEFFRLSLKLAASNKKVYLVKSEAELPVLFARQKLSPENFQICMSGKVTYSSRTVEQMLIKPSGKSISQLECFLKNKDNGKIIAKAIPGEILGLGSFVEFGLTSKQLEEEYDFLDKKIKENVLTVNTKSVWISTPECPVPILTFEITQSIEPGQPLLRPIQPEHSRILGVTPDLYDKQGKKIPREHYTGPITLIINDDKNDKSASLHLTGAERLALIKQTTNTNQTYIDYTTQRGTQFKCRFDKKSLLEGLLNKDKCTHYLENSSFKCLSIQENNQLFFKKFNTFQSILWNLATDPQYTTEKFSQFLEKFITENSENKKVIINHFFKQLCELDNPPIGKIAVFLKYQEVFNETSQKLLSLINLNKTETSAESEGELKIFQSS